MDLGALFHDLFFDYTLRTVALGAMVLGLVSGALGSFAVLRRQSLLGDAMSHAALPGVVLAFMLTGRKESGCADGGRGWCRHCRHFAHGGDHSLYPHQRG